MKLLLVLLFSLTLMAKIRVNVSTTTANFGGSRDTVEEAQKWIDKNIKNNVWGKPKRWVAFEGQENCLQTREFLGEIDETPRVECQLDKEYTITITDITAEVNAKKAAKLALKTERQEMKAMLADLHKYETVKEWRDKVNKVLRRLIKDSRD